MALARIQASIVKNLLEMGHQSSSQYQKIIDTEEELSGDAVETLRWRATRSTCSSC